MSRKRKQEKFEDERVNKSQPIVAKTNSQRKYLRAMQNNILVVGTGAAGTGKTYCAAAHAANRMIKDGVKIVLTRPYVGMGHSSGLWPGTIFEKLEPYLKPMLNVIEQRLGSGAFSCAIRNKNIAIQPLEAIRGMSFEDCILILDEAQNTKPEEIKSITTRIGEGSQFILCGDPAQTDIKGQNGLSFLTDLLSKYTVDNSCVVEFTSDDIVRSGITKQFVQIYDNMR